MKMLSYVTDYEMSEPIDREQYERVVRHGDEELANYIASLPKRLRQRPDLIDFIQRGNRLAQEQRGIIRIEMNGEEDLCIVVSAEFIAADDRIAHAMKDMLGLSYLLVACVKNNRITFTFTPNSL